jgi:hypothetical protein
MSKTKKPSAKGYVYCATHDIFFNPSLQQQTDEKNKELQEKGILLRHDACPMCQTDSMLNVFKFGATTHRR